jgi:hypothetical protein
MSLSDKDRELAKKHFGQEFFDYVNIEDMAAMLAERDALAIKAQDKLVDNEYGECLYQKELESVSPRPTKNEHDEN